MTDVIVKDSKIQGKGVFANKDFKKGDIVMRWNTSNTISKEEYDKLSDEEKRHITLLDNKYTIMQEPEKFVNHSCDSNTTAKNFCDIATKNIAKGEEITADYSDTITEGEEMICHCNSKNCKKIIKS